MVSAGYLIGRFLRRWAVIRLDALAPEDPEWRPLTIGLRRSGLLSYWFDHFGNWYQPLQTWPDYLAARSGSLRETIRRKTKRLAWEIEILDGTERLEHGIAEFETVYNRSWKEPEPFPAFNPALMRLAAARGMLRLGISRFEGRSVAAQFWIVEKLPGHHRATVLKLAHDEAHKAQSPGTVLTAFMIRALLERDAVQEIDFGRGDDPYKRLWAGIRRQRKGLLLINPRRPRGLSNLALTAAGAVRRRLRRIKIFAARSGTPHATY
ncbi:MAG: GNAT family N-acetyltransferase [Acetobacteraceae bacterium]|nr:GNAT family N-acetyltransferase [Acetobacteraceae bacterium]